MSKPDIDLVALAAMTNSNLKQIDNVTTGGRRPTNPLDIRKLVGGGNAPKPNTKPKFNILKGLDFIEPPKSTPLGMFDLDGNPVKRPDLSIVENELAHTNIPEFNDLNVLDELGKVNDLVPLPPSPPIRTEPRLDKNVPLDLFQFANLKQIVKEMDESILNFEHCIATIKSRRDAILELMKGI